MSSFLYFFGDSQALNLPLSSLHSKLELRSSAENLSVAFEPFTFGFLTVVFGALVSTVSEREAGEGSALPAASVARTATVWLPSASAPNVVGEVQPLNAPLSTAHSKDVPGSEENP